MNPKNSDRYVTAKALDALCFDAPPPRDYLHQARKTPKGSYNLWADYRQWLPEPDGTIKLTLAPPADVIDSLHFAVARDAITPIDVSPPNRGNHHRWTLAIKSPEDVVALGRIVAAVDAAIEAAAADEAAAKAAAKAKANREQVAKQAQDKIVAAYQHMTSMRRRLPVSRRMAIVLVAARNVTEDMLRQAEDGQLAPSDDWAAAPAINRGVKLALIDDPTGEPRPTPILDAAERVLDGVARVLTGDRQEGSQDWWDAILNAAVPCRKTDPMPYNAITVWERQFVQDMAQRRQKWEDGPRKSPFPVTEKQMDVLRRIYEKIKHYVVI